MQLYHQLAQKSSTHPSGTCWQLSGIQLQPAQLGRIRRHLDSQGQPPAVSWQRACANTPFTNRSSDPAWCYKIATEASPEALTLRNGLRLKVSPLPSATAAVPLELLPLMQQQRLGANQYISAMLPSLENRNPKPTLSCFLCPCIIALYCTASPHLLNCQYRALKHAFSL